MWLKVIIVILFLAVLASLSSALVFSASMTQKILWTQRASILRDIQPL